MFDGDFVALVHKIINKGVGAVWYLHDVLDECGVDGAFGLQQ